MNSLPTEYNRVLYISITNGNGLIKLNVNSDANFKQKASDNPADQYQKFEKGENDLIYIGTHFFTVVLDFNSTQGLKLSHMLIPL